MPWKTLAAGAAGMAQCELSMVRLKGLQKLSRKAGLQRPARHSLYVYGPLPRS
jgi:hypothetical protein